MHYKPMEDWLLQYGSKSYIAPQEWADLPDELQLQLENYAQDEAVNRALTLAKSGEIYSSDADAVGRLVSDMARVWMLDADAIRRIVETFTDALPPPPGEELDRTVVRLYRRRDSLNWQELKNLVDQEDFLKLIHTIVEYIQLNPKRNLAREDALQLLQKAYDDWVLHTPEAAIDELIHLLEKNDNHVAMQDVHDIFIRRNAINSAHAIELGMDLGVDSANPKELIRFLERFFDLMSKRGEMAMHLEYDVLELPDEDMDDDEAVIITAADDPKDTDDLKWQEAVDEPEKETSDIIQEAERILVEDEPQMESEEAEEEPAIADTEPEADEEVKEPADSAEQVEEDEIEEDEEIAIGMAEEDEETELEIDEETEDESVEGSVEVEDAASFGQEDGDEDETVNEEIEEEAIVVQEEEQSEEEPESEAVVEEVTPNGEIEIEEPEAETEPEETVTVIDLNSDVTAEAKAEEPMKREPVLPDFLASDTVAEHDDDKAIVGSWWEAQKKVYKEDKAKEAANPKGSIKTKTQAIDKKGGFLFWKKK